MNSRFKAKVWKWPGGGGWYFVNLDKALSERIKKVGKPYGSGFIKVRASIGETSWQTALFPNTRSKSYLLAIKASVRKKEEIFEDDIVKISFELV